MGLDYDVAILGGGLAGLSLAARLTARPTCRAVVIEPRTQYRRDRTWCYWRLHGHPFEAAVAHRWTSWEVVRHTVAGRLAAVQDSPDLPYEMIPADGFYDLARAVIERAPNITLSLGHIATTLREEADHVLVETGAGAIRAAFAFDSRPPAARSGDLAQRFLGQEITVSRPVFQPGRVTLMDFAVPQQEGAVHFLYVLPTSVTTALVEDTWLAPGDMALPDYRDSIRAYLFERYGLRDFAVSFEEEGAIPMSTALQAPRSVGRIVPIGTRGGAVKPSSGYGFLATQRMTDAIYRDLAAGRRPRPVPVRSAAARWMDEVFLRAITAAPERAPDIFHALFARCRPEPLVRFLNDLGRMSDYGRIIAASPKHPMIAAAVPWT